MDEKEFKKNKFQLNLKETNITQFIIQRMR